MMGVKNQPIRSFIRRERHSTRKTVPEALWTRYVISTRSTASLECFRDLESLTLEIGFGTGDTLFGQATKHLKHGYLGIEVYRRGIVQLLSKLNHTPLDNLKLLEGDAVKLLPECIPPNSIDVAQILFPDPWPKARHHKRRLIQPDFVHLLFQVMKPGGKLYLATDWQHYAQDMLSTLEASAFANEMGFQQFAGRPPNIPLTKFEQRGKKLGHTIFYLLFRKC
jgi:tRNA (guanine-N7-)-methyltransferase